MAPKTIPLPQVRPRRLRANEAIRAMVRETLLTPDDFIYPLFITHERDARREISSMPGQYQLGLDHLPAELDSIVAAGIRGVILFGIPAFKNDRGTESLGEDSIIARAVRMIKQHAPELYVITDVCLCEYTDHGHCGPLLNNGEVDNDATLELIARQAIVHARAGADMVAPSGMMDGMVAAIRAGLDQEQFTDVPIMSYAVKYASAFYGPFRDAAESAPQFGDRRSYQMDPPNRREALREAALDAEEGADILMVKPALAYLDIIREVRDSFDLPVAAYNVSGEFAMVHAAAEKGWIDGDRVMLEMLTAIKRAGAELILTYFAKEAARLLAKNS